MSWFSRLFASSKRGQPSENYVIADGPITLDVQSYNHTDVNEFTSLLCDGYVLSGSFTLNEIAEFVRTMAAQHSEQVLLATLDFTGQAFYTCGHAINSHDLDNLDGHDTSTLPPHCFENGEHKGYLTSKEEFFIRKANFLEKTTAYSLDDLLHTRWWSGIDDPVPSLLVPENVPQLARESRAYVQLVDVEHPYEALAAFPNGYFIDDYNPFENYVLAKYLFENFGFKLFGVGSTYLGFMRDTALDSESAMTLAEFLSRLYDNYDGELAHTALLANQLEDQTVIYIGYADR